MPSQEMAWVEWARALDRIPALSVRVAWRVDEPLELDLPFNQLVRGRLLASLRRTWCRTGAETCTGCPFLATCAWGRWVEAPAATLELPGAHGAQGPHPAWLRGLPAVLDLEADEGGAAEVILVGEATVAAELWQEALDRALGGLDGVALDGAELQPIWLGQGVDTDRHWRRVRLATQTPVDIRKAEVLDAEACPSAPWLVPLVRATVRRLRAVVEAYGPRGLGAQPERHPWPDLSQVELCSGEWARTHNRRFSMRQRRSMPIEGYVGDAEVRGEVMTHVGPLLQLGARLGIGKKTMFGLGQLQVEPVGYS